MTRLTLSSFRTKVSKLGIKGTKKGKSVFYTREQLENVHSGVAAKSAKKVKTAKKAKKPAKPKKTVRAMKRGAK